MKKVVFLLAVLLFALVFAVSCGDSSVTTDPTTEAEPIEKFESLKIADNSLDAYTIVYAESDLADEAAANPEFYPVWDFNRETAERLSDLIFEVSGVRLPIACDTETAEGEKEILIGKTNRAISETLKLSTIKASDYTVTVSGTKLVICGGQYGVTWHAVDYVEELFEKELAAGSVNYTLASDMLYSGSHKLLRIGCIGDSITQGVKCASPSEFGYPAQLERWLWKDVSEVYNFGNSGKTMRSDLADSYMNTGTYKNALYRAVAIDIFTVMLGTNDSNRDKTWTSADTARFKTDCETLFRTLSEKNSKMQFMIMNAPACFGERITSKFGSETVRGIQAELVGEMNDKGYKTSFFDMYSVTKEIPQHYPDDLHPDEHGHTVMAEALAKALDELINGKK